MQIFYNILRHPVFTHSHLCKYNYDILANCLFYNIIAVKNFTKMTTPIEASIRQKLTTQLETTHLEVINESYMHNVPKGSETHFKVVVVTDRFKDLPMIKRHRLVNDILKEELKSGVHALSIIAKTPDQWNSSDQKIEPSPNCRGGFGK